MIPKLQPPPDPLVTQQTCSEGNIGLFALFSSLGVEHGAGVRTTQQMTQSVLALRALVLRGRTETAFTPYKRKEESGGNVVNASRTDNNRYIRLGGVRDVDRLSNAWVRGTAALKNC